MTGVFDHARALDPYPVTRTIQRCWSTVTPESAELGDFDDTGDDGIVWDDRLVSPEDVIDEAVWFLERAGVCYASSCPYQTGAWFYTESYTSNFKTGETKEETFHLKGFSPAEEAAIAERLGIK